MTNDDRERHASRASLSAKRTAIALALGLLGGVVASLLLLRWAGVSPSALSQRVAGRHETNVRGLHELDETIGYVLKPGSSFRHETDEFAVTYRVDATGGRLVPGSDADLPGIDVYGDSWTFGHGADDAETYPALLHELLPGWSVRNRGVMGYGTVHSMLALQRDLQSANAPALAVYGWSPIHVLRNHLRASYVTNVAGGRTPRYEVGADGLEARGLVGSEAAVEDTAPELLAAEWERTVLAVVEMKRLATDRGTRFLTVILAGPEHLEGWDEMGERLKAAVGAHGVEVLDLTRRSPFAHTPGLYYSDDHPTPEWNALTASAIARAIDRSSVGLSVPPTEGTR